MKLHDLFDLLKQTVAEWLADKAPRLGAALAYYTLFSLAPLLILAIGMAGLVFGRQAAEGEIFTRIKDTVGPRSAAAVEDLIQQAANPASGTLATVLGVVTLLCGASGVFAELQDALNTIWKVTPKPGRGVATFLRERFLSFVMVLGIGVLLLVSLVLTALLAAAGKYLSPTWLPGGPLPWQVLNGVVALVVDTLLFALIFKVLPDVPLTWRDVGTGAFVTALLFTLGKYLIGLYLGHAGVASAYGAAGSLVVLLVWVYYSTQILLLGAEFTRVYTRQHGSHARPAP